MSLPLTAPTLITFADAVGHSEQLPSVDEARLALQAMLQGLHVRHQQIGMHRTWTDEERSGAIAAVKIQIGAIKVALAFI